MFLLKKKYVICSLIVHYIYFFEKKVHFEIQARQTHWTV